jgi:hypothetical protein
MSGFVAYCGLIWTRETAININNDKNNRPCQLANEPNDISTVMCAFALQPAAESNNDNNNGHTAAVNVLGHRRVRLVDRVQAHVCEPRPLVRHTVVKKLDKALSDEEGVVTRYFVRRVVPVG